MDVQAHIYYFGTVQGIGFRYTAQQLASQLGLNGWVKNLKDGSVEIIAEGRRETIEELQKSLEKHFEGYIRDRKVTIQERTSSLSAGQAGFEDFKVIY